MSDAFVIYYFAPTRGRGGVKWKLGLCEKVAPSVTACSELKEGKYNRAKYNMKTTIINLLYLEHGQYHMFHFKIHNVW